MSDPTSAKRLLGALLADLSGESSPAAAIDRYCAEDCRWDVFHPFDTTASNAAVVSQFWATLSDALPDLEMRPAFLLAGGYEGRTMASAWGLVLGTFDFPWLGIPPTHGLVALRFGIHVTVRDGRISRVWLLLDLIDLMLQAGVYPFRPMPGAALQWPFPPCDTGATALSVDVARGTRALAIIREMQVGLPPPSSSLTREEMTARHSPHWHTAMNWYGPAGIGSSRGLRGFRNFHGALWLQAFPNRTGFPRQTGANEDTPGHIIQVGDGNYAVTGGWPCMQATHTGAEWLGLPPTGAALHIRIADWYRLDDTGKIIDNWVMIDVPHMLRQMGMDLFHDLSFRTNPASDRWPETPPFDGRQDEALQTTYSIAEPRLSSEATAQRD